MMALSTTQFSLDSGNLSLDFANTFDPRLGPDADEKLTDYAALLDFASRAGLIDDATARELADWSRARPHDARAVHARAVALREAIFAVVSAVAAQRPPDAHDLAILQQSTATALEHGRLAVTARGFDWRWDAEMRHLERPLWPIAHAATRLLTSQDLGRLRICAADDCDWLFYDTSRNQSRKWCDMSTCGNRAKVAKYREQGIGNRD
jgi:predicted RNA-binding Zn ribbon-like protein